MCPDLKSNNETPSHHHQPSNFAGSRDSTIKHGRVLVSSQQSCSPSEDRCLTARDSRDESALGDKRERDRDGEGEGGTEGEKGGVKREREVVGERETERERRTDGGRERGREGTRRGEGR